jgi:hypothetical protein
LCSGGVRYCSPVRLRPSVGHQGCGRKNGRGTSHSQKALLHLGGARAKTWGTTRCGLALLWCGLAPHSAEGWPPPPEPAPCRVCHAAWQAGRLGQGTQPPGRGGPVRVGGRGPASGWRPSRASLSPAPRSVPGGGRLAAGGRGVGAGAGRAARGGRVARGEWCEAGRWRQAEAPEAVSRATRHRCVGCVSSEARAPAGWCRGPAGCCGGEAGGASRRSPVPAPVPNQGVQATAASVRCAPAVRRA